MIIVDKYIRMFLINGQTNVHDQTAIYNGIEECVTNIGYDLRADFFVKPGGKQVETCELAPGESAFVSSQERVKFDNMTAGIVRLKNSRIRMGLTMDAPAYQPGHETNIFFRVTNLSNASIELKRGEKYAMLMFEQLSEAPDAPYTGTYQNERDFTGLAKYDSEYADQIKSIEGKVENLKELEKSLYGNVITILTIFIAIFSILNVNISLAMQAATAMHYLVFNLATVGAISFLAALLNEIVFVEKKSRWIWCVPIVSFTVLAGIVILSILI